MTSSKHFVVTSGSDCLVEFNTKEEAVTHAKRKIGSRDCCESYDSLTVYQAVAVVSAPVPEAIVSEIAA